MLLRLLPRPYRLILVPVLLFLGACQSQKPSELPPKDAKPLRSSAGEAAPSSQEGRAVDEPKSEPWEETTFSPRPGSAPDPRLQAAEEACGVGDASLHEVATWLAQHFSEHEKATSIDFANFHMRRRGLPYVMPRLWSAQMSEVDGALVAESVGKWAHLRSSLGEYRCGVGAAQLRDGTFGVIVIQADVLADIQPLPTQVDAGIWLELDAQLLVSGTDATVLLLPPEGLPRKLRTKLEGTRVRARFPIETDGTWMVQLMATVSGGPRPVAQMSVTAGQRRPHAPDAHAVPGENGIDESAPRESALFAAINTARVDQGLPPLKRNRRLDAIARAHSEAMMRQGRISHDTGLGDPAYRVELAGLRPKATGENVALAGTVIRLHRALWNSPSHRENMLLLRWDEVGVAIVEGGDHSLYATQLYVDDD